MNLLKLLWDCRWEIFGIFVVLLGGHAIVTTNAGYEAVIEAAPVMHDFYIHIMGAYAVLAGVMIPFWFGSFEHDRRMDDLEERIEELEEAQTDESSDVAYD